MASINLKTQENLHAVKGFDLASWVDKLNSSNSRLHKEEVLEQALASAKLGATDAFAFLYSAHLAYNPYEVYRVKQVPTTDSITTAENPWTDFWYLLRFLEDGRLTGHAARDAIADMSARFDSENWNKVCRAVIVKDLRAGITSKTFNKIMQKTDLKIPVFEVQLATDIAKHQTKLDHATTVLVEPKLDGVRVVAMCAAPGNVTLFSRSGRVFENFPHIQEQLGNIVDEFSKRAFNAHVPFILDGEIVSSSFQELMKQAHRKTDVDASDSVFHVFDLLKLSEFGEGHSNVQAIKRRWALDKGATSFKEACPNVEVVPAITINVDSEEGKANLEKHCNDYVAKGFEGMMIKFADAPYECKRSHFWLKWKPVISVDLTVVDVEEGTGRNKGRAGALVCEGVDDGRTIMVNVGSGLSDDARTDIWLDRGTVVGQVVEVKADAVTLNQDGTYSLRFPRFERFRGFAPGEKT